MRKFVILLILSIFSTGLSWAQETIGSEQSPIDACVDQTSSSALQVQISANIPTVNKISLEEAVDLAIKNNIDIRKTRLDIDKAKNDIKSANRLQNPYFQTFNNFGTAGLDNPNENGLIIPIEIAKRNARKRLAKSELELTEGNTALAEFYLKMEVRDAYIELVSSKSILKIIEDQKALLEDLLYIAQKKYEVGAAPQMEVIQAKMALGQIMTQLNTAKTAVEIAKYSFNKTLNIKDNSVLYDTAEDSLPDKKGFERLLTPAPHSELPDFEEISDIALNKRLDIQNAQKEVDVAKKNLTVVMRKRVPDIEIGGGLLSISSSMSTLDRSAKGAYVAGNITNIPLLYQYAPEIKNAKIEVEQSELKYDSVKNKAMQDLHSSYDKFLTAQNNLNYYNDALLAESNKFLGMSHKSYMIGKTNITDYIFIQQSYKNIVMGYVNALSEYYSSWVEFLRDVNDEDINLNEK
ncbi:MAG: TolC family protein [Candidatus Gastranaerophilales bacterium]|nr:TolC family protein [Candidatus Gastranaerophilales bacterium]